MVDFLAGRQDIMTLTPSIYIAKLLIAAKIPACFCGGKLLENSQVLGGRINQLILNSMPVDYMFFSPHAINEQGIIFDSVENKCPVPRKVQCMPLRSLQVRKDFYLSRGVCANH